MWWEFCNALPKVKLNISLSSHFGGRLRCWQSRADIGIDRPGKHFLAVKLLALPHKTKEAQHACGKNSYAPLIPNLVVLLTSNVADGYNVWCSPDLKQFMERNSENNFAPTVTRFWSRYNIDQVNEAWILSWFYCKKTLQKHDHM